MKRKMFNYRILTSVLTLISMHGIAQKAGDYTISGDIKGAQKVYFYEHGSRFGSVTDSIVPQNGRFQFKGNVKSVDYASIEIDKGDKFPIFVDLILEAGNIVIKGPDYTNLYPSGTFDNNLFAKINTEKELIDSNRIIIPFYDKANYFNEKLFYLRKEENPDEEKIKLYTDSVRLVETRIGSYMNWRIKKMKEKMLENPNTYFTAATLLSIYSGIDSNIVSRIYHDLGPEIKSSAIGIKLKKDIEVNKGLNDGIAAPKFTTTDINGNKISLSDFKGKYVLLDFWATWCSPCRASNPSLIKIYNKYHGKGLEIIGISDDDKNINGWKKAVKVDKTGIWHQVLRGAISQGNNESVDLANLYNVHAYPTQYLIDKDGNIISTFNIESLEKKLTELMP